MREFSAVGRHRMHVCAWLLLIGGLSMRVILAYVGVPPVVELIGGDVLAYLLPLAVGLVLGIVLFFRLPNPSTEAPGWMMLGAACGLVCLSESYWTAYAATIDPNGPPSDSWILIVNAVAVLLLLRFVTRMTWLSAEPRIRRARLYLDVLTAMLVAFPAVYVFWTLPIAGPEHGVLAAATLAVYPLVGIMVAFASSSVALRFGERRRPVWDRLAGLAILVFGIGLALFPVWFPPQISMWSDSPDWYTIIVGAGIDLMLVAMVYRLSASADDVAVEPWPRPVVLPAWAAYALQGAAAAGLVAIGGFAYASGNSGPVVPLQLGAIALAVVLASRSWVAALERAAARRSANTDSATGAFTRVVLDTRLRELIEYSTETGHELSVVAFDFRDMRRAGRLSRVGSDQSAAQSLVRAIRTESAGASEVFRIGGDRFTVLLPGEGEASAAAFALRVWLSQRPSGGGHRSSHAGVCAGIAVFPVHAADSERLLAATEVALTAARGADDEPVAVFDESMAVIPEEERAARERMRELRATVRALAEAVDARDPATREHSANVAELATALSQVLGLSDRAVQIVGLAALMHDIGKIGIRDEILLKPGPLDTSERIEMEEHSALGERILSPARLDDILPAVRSHHERWDGTGYPDGLAGDEIPLEARILAVCDAFETMTTGRVYCEVRSAPDALLEIEANAGTQFDPGVAGAFARMVRGLRAHTAVRVTSDPS